MDFILDLGAHSAARDARCYKPSQNFGIDLTEIPDLLKAYAQEKDEIGKFKNPSGAKVDFSKPDFSQQLFDLSQTRDQDLKHEFSLFPAHLRLSNLLDAAIIEVVRKDKKLLRGIYRELLSEYSIPFSKIIKPLARVSMELCFTSGPARLIETLVQKESSSRFSSRAELCSRILQRITGADSSSAVEA